MSENKNSSIMSEDEKRERKIVKKAILILLGICLLAGTFYGGMNYGRGLPASHRFYLNNKTYAKVDDTKITGADLKKVMEPIFYANGLQELTASEIDSYEMTMLEYLINVEVLYKAADKAGIEVTDEQVDEYYEETINNANSKYNLTEEEYIKTFKQSKDEIKLRIKKELMGVTYLENNTSVDEAEASAYYEKNKSEYEQIGLSYVFISNYEDSQEVSSEQKSENEKTIKAVLKFAKSGEDFDTLVDEYSDEIVKSDNYVSKDQINTELSEAVFSLKDGEVYDEVVETSTGYYVVKRTGTKESSFDEIKDSLIETLKNNKQNTLLKDLYEKYNVEIKG